MVHSNNWDETVPTNTTNATDIDDHIRKVRLDIRERFGIDHKIAASDDADVAYGVHTKVTLEAAIAEPTLAVDEACIYRDSGDVAGELRFLDSRGISGMTSFIGEVKMRMGYTVPEGWLALNGNTIGGGASGADHAGDEFEELFTFLWEELADAQAPVSTGRGANAAADWAASETLTMPDSRARMPIGVGTPQYEKLEFTSGGTHEVVVGDTLDGDTSAETLVVVEVVLLTGTWAGEDAAGYFIVHQVSGVFVAEDLSEGANSNVCTIAADCVPYTTKVIGEIGGVETYDYDYAHTHAVGTYAVASHNHQVYESVNSSSSAQYYNSGGSLVTLGVGDTKVQGGLKYWPIDATQSDTSSTNCQKDAWSSKVAPALSGSSEEVGSTGTQSIMNPFLAVAFLIKY